MRFRVRAGLFVILAALSGCASHRHIANADSGLGPTTIIYSPNAEPLNGGALGRPTCDQAMSRWFDRIDASHSGAISRDAFLADAAAQFHRMDIDNNGYLLPEELERYRLPFRQTAETDAGQGDNSGESQHKHGRGNRGDNGSSQPPPGDQPDPVMSADTDNRFRVTFDEFMAQAKNKFASLDADHNGSLSRDEVLKLCGKPEK